MVLRLKAWESRSPPNLVKPLFRISLTMTSLTIVRLVRREAFCGSCQLRRTTFHLVHGGTLRLQVLINWIALVVDMRRQMQRGHRFFYQGHV